MQEELPSEMGVTMPTVFERLDKGDDKWKDFWRKAASPSTTCRELTNYMSARDDAFSETAESRGRMRCPNRDGSSWFRNNDGTKFERSCIRPSGLPLAISVKFARGAPQMRDIGRRRTIEINGARQQV